MTPVNNQVQSAVKEFLKETLKEMMGIFKADCGSLFLFDDKNKELVLDSIYNGIKIKADNIKFRVGEGVSGKVAEKKTPVLVKDIDRDGRFNKNGYKHYHTKSFISIPLNGSDGLLGLINLADKADGTAFTEQELSCATTLAEYACIIANNLYLEEKLRMEKAELDKQKALLEKYASVGKLAAGIVHEVNNPLDGIIRFTNMLLNQIDHGSVAREYLLEIKRGLNRIENITKSLLQFSHQVNPHTMKVKNYADVHELIEESLSIFEARLTHHFAVHKYFNMSRTRILDIGVAHIFINLIKNALDAMPNGGTLEISTDSDEEWVRVNFKDSGCGMSAELCERIFEPFFTTKNMDKGSGLGLAICREIINRYEGSILVESVPGKGSTFRVMIPIKFCENV